MYSDTGMFLSKLRVATRKASCAGSINSTVLLLKNSAPRASVFARSANFMVHKQTSRAEATVPIALDCMVLPEEAITGERWSVEKDGEESDHLAQLGPEAGHHTVLLENHHLVLHVRGNGDLLASDTQAPEALLSHSVDEASDLLCLLFRVVCPNRGTHFS